MTILFENIKCTQTGEHEFAGEATINPTHSIMKAHFPGKPIVPGVMLLEFVNIMVSKAIGKELKLLKIENVKFVRPVIPKVNELMKIDFSCLPTETGYTVGANIYYEGEITAQYKNLFYCHRI